MRLIWLERCLRWMEPVLKKRLTRLSMWCSHWEGKSNYKTNKKATKKERKNTHACKENRGHADCQIRSEKNGHNSFRTEE